MTDDRDLAVSWNQKGVNYAKLEMWHVATKYFEKCVEVDPDCGEYWNNLGSVYGDQWKFAEAIPYHEKAVACSPHVGRFWVKLGIAYGFTGEMEKALFAYDEGLKNDPEDPDLWFNKGVCLIKENRFIEAKEVFEKTLELLPGERQVVLHLNHCEEHIEHIAIMGIVDSDPSGMMKGAIMYWNMDEIDKVFSEMRREYHE
jgi:tetratricopeptide (TPR) repeat protein